MIARLARQVELAVATTDLTLAQYRVLGILGDGREAASALAEKLAVSRPSVTGVVDGLVARGLACRDPDRVDRRRIGVYLTAPGRRVLALADAEVEARLTAIIAHGSGEADAALAGLRPWRDALDAYRAARRANSAPLEVTR